MNAVYWKLYSIFSKLTRRLANCARSFFAYSLENCFQPHDNCRFNFNANISQRDIEDTYLPAFQTTVEVGRVTGLMCSENAVNNQPTCANHWAMTTVARDSWGFDGCTFL